MTATTASTVRSQELVSFGLIESASVNSITDFNQSKLNECKVTNENNDFVNTFVCHLIFYVLYFVSLVLYILIDLGLGTFIRNKFVQLLGIRKKSILGKYPAFA